MVHHDLWDMDPSAAPQLTTIRQNGRNRDVVAVTGKTGWLYVFDRVTGEPIWPIEERPVPKSDMPGEQSWPTQPVPTKPAPYIKHTFSVDDISPYLPAEDAEALKTRLLAADEQGHLHADQLQRHGACADEQRRHALRRHGGRTPHRRGLRRRARQPGHPPPAAPRTRAAAAAVPPVPPGQPVYQQNCQVCHGADRLGTDTGVPLVYAAADPANNIVAGAPRFDAATIRAVLATGKGRMPAFPHLSAADVDNLVAFLTAPPGGRGVGRGGRFAGRGAVRPARARRPS